MASLLTYPPEIVIESRVELPLDLPGECELVAGSDPWISPEAGFELAVFAIELVGNLLERL